MLTAFLKIYWNKLKNSSVYKTLINNWFLVAFFLVLSILLLKSYFAILFIFVYGFYLFKTEKKILYISLIIIFLCIIRYTFIEIKYESENIDSVIGYVKDVK